AAAFVDLEAFDAVDDVRLTGSLGDGVARLEINEGRGKHDIRVRSPRNSSSAEPNRLVLENPHQNRLDEEPVAATVDGQGVAGETLQIESVSGRVTAVGAPRKASVETVSGDVRLNLNSREVDVESVSGNIALRGRIAGSIEVETVSGDLDLDTRGERLANL